MLLKKAPANGKSSWMFHLRAAGLARSWTKPARSSYVKPSGAAKIVLPPIETWDSSGTARTGPAMTGGTYQVSPERGRVDTDRLGRSGMAA